MNDNAFLSTHNKRMLQEWSSYWISQQSRYKALLLCTVSASKSQCVCHRASHNTVECKLYKSQCEPRRSPRCSMLSECVHNHVYRLSTINDEWVWWLNLLLTSPDWNRLTESSNTAVLGTSLMVVLPKVNQTFCKAWHKLCLQMACLHLCCKVCHGMYHTCQNHHSKRADMQLTVENKLWPICVFAAAAWRNVMSSSSCKTTGMTGCHWLLTLAHIAALLYWLYQVH